MENNSNHSLRPDIIFEVSWEICNKVGGIYTVISTRARTLVTEYGDSLILLGPDIYRDSEKHPEFTEEAIYPDWADYARKRGLRFKIGRWNISGSPVAILVDFSTYISEKDKVFTEFWEKYGLDSIAGQWDYIEPALFGYACARIIESFYDYQLSKRTKVTAQFHEWMTGTGLLYLKSHKPQIATLFTTHATVVGRSIAGNQIPLYSQLEKYNGDIKARDFNVVSKQSLEKISAREADCFTTVSEITNKECKQFLEKEVDVVTPNGFEDTFVPDGDEFHLLEVEARVKLFEVAEALLAYEVSKRALIIGASGRYEYKNKGLDVFIQSLGDLNKSGTLDREILAFIMVPASHHGPRRDVFKNLQDNENVVSLNNPYLTHYLNDAENDPVLRKIREAELFNRKDDKVKIFFVPCYLNGNDGIFDRAYYNLLIGFHLTVFASYYEPWGYTPLESIAFHIPTITTSLAGFGLWVRDYLNEKNKSVFVVERTDTNDVESIREIYQIIERFNKMPDEEFQAIRNNAADLSKEFLWPNFIDYYKKAYSVAISKVEDRINLFVEPEKFKEEFYFDRKHIENNPNWKRLIINHRLPEKLKALDELSKNLWWSWNPEAIDLFESIDKEAWFRLRENPIEFLESIPLNRLNTLANDQSFVDRLHRVYDMYREYMNKRDEQQKPCIAYFSMEYGIHHSLKTYSGGLGILAGDYLKEASDQNVQMIGIGLLYKYGYFNQKISPKGHQISAYEAVRFAKSPVTPVRDEHGNWKYIDLGLPGRRLKARIWKVQVGRVDLYLLDTDYEENIDQDRTITHHLYGGDNENRLKQEILLGIGGIRALKELGIIPDVYHCNEGHAAFIGIERLYQYISNENLSFSESLELVRSSTLFTTHTPVPAGHDVFTEELLRTYLADYSGRLHLTWMQFLNLGKINPEDASEKFSMSNLAANLSQEMNGVSKLHGQVSREMFAPLYPGYFPDELHIGHVTNGVHFQSWASPVWRRFFKEAFGDDFENNLLNKSYWEKINLIDENEIWQMRKHHKQVLIDCIRKRFDTEDNFMFSNPKNLVEVKESLHPEKLIVGFARRFATYKRAHLLFKDLERLSAIVNNPQRPVIFLFAGKAHPNDKAGQDLIKHIVDVSMHPNFIGKVIFIPDYDIQLAKKLVQGVDVWLNTPTRPLEASGTSGQKVLMNGGLNFSVLDGWWVEGFKSGGGWAVTDKRTYSNQELQDEIDAETIYSIFENEIVPLYYYRTKAGVPEEWVQFIKKSIATIAPDFTTSRMLDDYIKQYYLPLHDRHKKLLTNEFKEAERIALWKKEFFNRWNGVKLVSSKQLDVSREQIFLGQEYRAEIVLDLNGIEPEHIGLELVFSDMVENGKVNIVYKKELKYLESTGNHAKFYVVIVPHLSGGFDFGIRIFPLNKSLPHRQDFNFVKWI